MASGREAGEGVSAAEIAKELREQRAEAAEAQGRDRAVAIAEAVLLSVVAVLAAVSGYSAAQRGTHSSILLAGRRSSRSHSWS
jgi:hypothetical protein